VLRNQPEDEGDEELLIKKRNQPSHNGYELLPDSNFDGRSTTSDFTGRENRSKKIILTDCEHFKFGIYKDIRKFCSIPGFWIVSAVIIFINGTLVYILPMLFLEHGCHEGYDYGAW